MAAGEGDPPLVLLHGFGASCYTWDAVAGSLSHRHRLVAFDRCGFGRSQRPAPSRGRYRQRDSPYSEEASVTAVFAAMDAWSLDRAVLVGSSAGGVLALLAALGRPERTRALVLVDAPALSSVPPAVVKAAFRAPGSARFARPLLRAASGWFDWGLRRAWHDPSRLSEDSLARYRDEWFQPGWETALIELTRSAPGARLRERLGEVHQPVLVMTGSNDRLVRPAQAEVVAGALHDARLVVVEDCGHLPHEEQPERFVTEVESFLAERC